MSIRNNLGDKCSIVCFKSIIEGVEDILGTDGAAALLIRSGRVRGGSVATSLGLAGKNPSPAEIRDLLDNALGASGTCLCAVTDVSETPGGGYFVKTTETVCSAGEGPDSSRMCTYTLGAVWGFVEAVTGKRFSGSHVASVLKGSATDDFQFTAM